MIVKLANRFDADFFASLSRWGEGLDAEADGFSTLTAETFSPGARWKYGHPVGQYLLEQLTAVAADMAGEAVRPCHSVVRIVSDGARILPHTDRVDVVPPAADLNICAYSNGKKLWPFKIQRGGKSLIFSPKQGEGVFFRATTEEHGRVGRFDGTKHVNIVLCYAAIDDKVAYPHAARFDDRADAAADGAGILYRHQDA